MPAHTTTANQNETAHDFVDKAADKIHKIINDAGGEVEETTDALKERLQVNPIASLLIALTAGVLLDRVVRPRPAEASKSHSATPELLLGLTAIGQTALSQFLYRRLFAETAKITALIVFGALLAGVGVIGGFYALYLTLLGYGLSAQAATASIAGGAIALAAIVAGFAARSVRRLQRTALVAPAATLARRVAKIVAKEFQRTIG